jgi:hypothetical protein
MYYAALPGCGCPDCGKPIIILVLGLFAMRIVQSTPERLILFEGAIK